jgi:DNA excision repair protein ERCC-4
MTFKGLYYNFTYYAISYLRLRLYTAGGVIIATSRTLVVDILNNVFPIHLLTGVIVAQAHM